MPRTGWLTILLICGMLPFISAPDARAWDNRLVDAVRYGDLELARHLLEDGFAIDVNDCDNKRQTPLSLAILRQNLEMVDLLLDHGAEFRTGEHYSNYSIVMAVSTGNAETVAILLDHGADVNARYVRDGRFTTVLHKAVGRMDLDIVRLLLERGAEVNPRSVGDLTSYTVLHAVFHRSGSHGILTDHPTHEWQPRPGPQGRPIRERRVELAELLLAAGADIHSANRSGESVLEIVCDQKYYFRHREEAPAIIELVSRRNLETLPLKIDEQGNTHLDGWGTPCNGLVARGYLNTDGRQDEPDLEVCWEVLNIGEETTTFVYAHAGMPLVLVTDENGEEPQRTREQVRMVYSFENQGIRGWDSPFRPFYPGQTGGFCLDLHLLYNLDRPGTYTVSIQYKNLHEKGDPDLVKAIPFEIEVGE